MNERNDILMKKLKFFKSKNISVHISKNNGWFHNGKILELQGDLVIIKDKKTGAIPIYFLEIKEVEGEINETNK
jgi:hypothetical protein|tara:strand:+ start:228 stop:449 length:222 start_codon:yes stop_codon:yes gene_type:complete